MLDRISNSFSASASAIANRIKYIAAGILFIALIAIIGSYFFFHGKARTPDYALNMLNNSIELHDSRAFNSVIDIEQVLNSSYDGFVDGLMESDRAMSPEAREAITNFTQMLRTPIINSLKTAIENYVATGKFDQAPTVEGDDHFMAATDIMARAGLSKLEFRKIDGVTIDPNNDERAIADIRFYQPEANDDFIFKVILERGDDENWRVIRIDNFREFTEIVAQIRRVALDKYLDQTSEINLRHDQTIREAEQKYGSILSLGSLGQDQTRFDLKILLTDVVKKDWEVRKQELFSVEVPKAAETLQNLRLKICDLSIGSAEDYAKWMEDKKGSTVKSAEDKRKQVQALMEEERILISRMTRQPVATVETE